MVTVAAIAMKKLRVRHSEGPYLQEEAELQAAIVLEVRVYMQAPVHALHAQHSLRPEFSAWMLILNRKGSGRYAAHSDHHDRTHTKAQRAFRRLEPPCKTQMPCCSVNPSPEINNCANTLQGTA